MTTGHLYGLPLSTLWNAVAITTPSNFQIPLALSNLCHIDCEFGHPFRFSHVTTSDLLKVLTGQIFLAKDVANIVNQYIVGDLSSTRLVFCFDGPEWYSIPSGASNPQNHFVIYSK